MKSYWLYLESYSFIFEGVQGLIIYNALSGSVVTDNRDFEVKDFIRKLMLPDMDTVYF